jgi:hypothetical protein
LAGDQGDSVLDFLDESGGSDAVVGRFKLLCESSGEVRRCRWFWMRRPKGWAFALGALAAYTTADGDVLRETLVIASILAMACLGSVVIWAGFGDRALVRQYARTLGVQLV